MRFLYPAAMAQSLFKLAILGTVSSVLATALIAFLIVLPGPVSAKAPGKTYCFVGKCHRVKTLGETNALVGKSVPLVASHYNDCRKDRYNPCGLTSSGEPFHATRADNAASPIYPDGTVLLVRNPKTKAAAVLRINNAGPYWGNRKLDVSYAAAERLGFRRRGVAKLETRILSAPNRGEARYKRRRAYRPVPGFIGKFESLAAAENAAIALMVLDASSASMLAPSNSAALLASARRHVKKSKKVREKERRQLAPIIKTMRMIADLKPQDANPIQNTNSVPSGLDTRRIAQLPSAPPLGNTDTSGSPQQGLARAVLANSNNEAISGEGRPPAAQLIKTAAVGSQIAPSWKSMFRKRIGDASLERATRAHYRSALLGNLKPSTPHRGPIPDGRARPAPFVDRFGLAG